MVIIKVTLKTKLAELPYLKLSLLDFVAYGHGQRVMPAIWFRYEVSPITVKYTHKKKPLYHFLTTFCAIIGGTFTVAGMIDSMIFSAHNMVKKAQEGKLS